MHNTRFCVNISCNECSIMSVKTRQKPLECENIFRTDRELDLPISLEQERLLRSFGCELDTFLINRVGGIESAINQVSPDIKLSALIKDRPKEKSNLQEPNYNTQDALGLNKVRTSLEEHHKLKSLVSTATKIKDGKQPSDLSRCTFKLDNCPSEDLSSTIHSISNLVSSSFPGYNFNLTGFDAKYKGGFGAVAILYDVSDIQNPKTQITFEIQINTTQGMTSKSEEEDRDLFKLKCEQRSIIIQELNLTGNNKEENRIIIKQVESQLVKAYKQGEDYVHNFVASRELEAISPTAKNAIVEYLRLHTESEEIYSRNPSMVSSEEQKLSLQSELDRLLLQDRVQLLNKIFKGEIKIVRSEL